MGLFALPPKQLQDAFELDTLLGDTNEGTADYRTKRMLAPEWFPQSGVQLTWPHAATDWKDMLEEVTECYLRMAYEIAKRTRLLIVTPEPDRVKQLLQERLPKKWNEQVVYAVCPTNDTWARDHAFLTVVGTGGIELMDYTFNGWGGKFEAAYDNAINRHLANEGFVKGTYVDRMEVVLEGGGIESDGLGTLLTTSQCLLNPNRNPQMDKNAIEAMLLDDFGAKQVLWIDHGYLAGDDTDSHVDTLARLCPEHTIVYVQCNNPADEHYEALQAMEQQLKTFRTPEGEPFRLLALPMAAPAYDDDGERLPATYANYLVMDHVVLYPIYAQPELDEQAKQVLQKAFPRRDIVGIDCRALIKQHGSLHCATMQYPKGVFR